jgi:hypothetical protein
MADRRQPADAELVELGGPAIAALREVFETGAMQLVSA